VNFSASETSTMPPSVAIKDDPQTHHLMQSPNIIPSSEYDKTVKTTPIPEAKDSKWNIGYVKKPK
jgi:hypothetical protein